MAKPKSTSLQDTHEANDDNLQLDPLIDALLGHLPAPGDTFTKEDRELWLQIIGLAFKLIYQESEESEPETPPT